jgi:hypothetical protein
MDEARQEHRTSVYFRSEDIAILNEIKIEALQRGYSISGSQILRLALHKLKSGHISDADWKDIAQTDGRKK